jgi:hypothetical protein
MVDAIVIKGPGICEGELKGITVSHIPGIEYTIGIVPGTTGSGMHRAPIINPPDRGARINGE